MTNPIFLNNREIASLIWLIVGLIAILSNEKTRRALSLVFKALIQWKIILLSVFFIIWTSISILILAEAGIWSASLLKPTALWFFFSAIWSIYLINTKNSSREFLKEWTFETISILIFIEFLVNYYVFNLAIEIIIQPAIFLILSLYYFTENKEEHRPTYILSSFLLVAFGIAIMIFAVLNVAESPYDVLSRETLFEFLYPLILSVLSLPFLFALNYFIVASREINLLETHVFKRNIGSMERYKIFRILAFRLSLLNRFRRYCFIHWPKSNEQILSAALQIRKNYKNQRQRSKSKNTDPWSVTTLMYALSKHGLPVKYYDMHLDDWYGSSDSLKEPEESSMNFIEYSISGSQHSATSLTLGMEIFEVDRCKIISSKFEIFSNILLNKFFADEKEFLGDNFTLYEGNILADLKTDYRGGKQGFASRTLKISKAEDRTVGFE